MTELSLPDTTHTAQNVALSIGNSAPAHPSDNQDSASVFAEDDEEYTIKCICDFDDDDGNTVFCESCQTWQHIECYYITGKVPEVHNCADCESRFVDAKRATQRQRKKREQIQIENGDRKIKKTTGKSHKKKTKVPEQATNGWSYGSVHESSSGSPRDQPPPAKRPKTSHRASSSMTSHATASVPVLPHSKRSASASHALKSPSKTPTSNSPNGYRSEPYSREFLELYENDPGDTAMEANLFNDIAITSSLSLWTHDVAALDKAANGKTPQDVFLRCDQPLDSMTLPELHIQTKTDKTVEYHGKHPQWTFLTIETFTPQNSIVGELRGKIGHMQDYVQDPVNRWAFLRHPLPFVFFHPRLPIYIDTRREGSKCRYLRRSCRPNLVMKTILENGSDYRFCFVANKDLEAGTELTVGWILDTHMRNYVQRNNDIIKQEGVDDPGEDYVTAWVGKVLADFGGCACGDPVACTMALYDCRSNGFPPDTNIHLVNGRGSKGRKTNGQPQNSRASSESLKHQEDEDYDDRRSNSGSGRSKPQSRDLTPIGQTSGVLGSVPGVELSDREKRKIAAMEQKFERLEQDKQQPSHKKKKRNSGGSTVNTPSVVTSKQIGYPVASMSQPGTPSCSTKPRYVDVGTSRKQSGSPATKSHFARPPSSTHALDSSKSTSHPTSSVMASSLKRSKYVDSSTQTDLDEPLFPVESAGIMKHRPHMSLTKRLLMRCHQERVELEKRRDAIVAHLESEPTPDETLVDGHSAERAGNDVNHVPGLKALISEDAQRDIAMEDAESSIDNLPVTSPQSPLQKPRPPDVAPNPVSPTTNGVIIKPPPPPIADHKSSTNGLRPIELRVQLPPKQQFSGTIPSISTPTPMITPTSISNSIAQSPASSTPSTYPPLVPASANAVQPSPVKKKLSLGDYMSRRSNKAEAVPKADKDNESSPTSLQTMLKPSASLVEEAKVQGNEGTALMETPNKEMTDPIGGNEKDLKT